MTVMLLTAELQTVTSAVSYDKDILRDMPADAAYLCDKAAVLGYTIKWTLLYAIVVAAPDSGMC
jgi:hypothetical protein